MKPGTLAHMGVPETTRRVLVVDDSPLQCESWRKLLYDRYGDRAGVEVYTNPVTAVTQMRPDVHLLLLDWEMPELDGKQVFEAATRAGVNPKRIIIMSCHPANRLHEEFDPLGCLAVIEKAEPEQQAAFLMILDSIMKR